MMKELARNDGSKVSFDKGTGDLWVGFNWEPYKGEGSCVRLDKGQAQAVVDYLNKYINKNE